MARIKFLQEDFAGFRPDREVKKIADPNKLDPLQTIAAIRSGVQATKEIAGAGMDVADFLTRVGVIGPKSKEQLMEEAAKKRAAEAAKAREAQRAGLVAGQEKFRAGVEGVMEDEGPADAVSPLMKKRFSKRSEFVDAVNKFKAGEINPAEFAGIIDTAVKEGTIRQDEATKFADIAASQAEQRAEREKALLAPARATTLSPEELQLYEQDKLTAEKDKQLIELARQEGRQLTADELMAIKARQDRIEKEEKLIALTKMSKLEELAGTRPLEKQLQIEQKFDLMRQGKEGQTEEQARGAAIESRVPTLKIENITQMVEALPRQQAEQVFNQLDAIAPADRTPEQQKVFNALAEKYKEEKFVKDKLGDELATITTAYNDYVGKAEERKQAIRQSNQLTIDQKKAAIADIDRKIADARATTEQMKAKQEEQKGVATNLATKQEELNQADLAVRDAKFNLDKVNADPTIKDPAIKAQVKTAYDTAVADKAKVEAEVKALQGKLEPTPTPATPTPATPTPTTQKGPVGPELQRAVEAAGMLLGKKKGATPTQEKTNEEVKAALEKELAGVQDRVKELEANEDTRSEIIKNAAVGLITASAELQQLNDKRNKGPLTKDEAFRMVQLKEYISSNQGIVKQLQELKAEDPKVRELVMGLKEGKVPPLETAEQAEKRFDEELRQFDAGTAEEIKKAAEQGAKEIGGKIADAEQLKMLAIGAVLTNDRELAQDVLAFLRTGNVVGLRPQSLTDYLSGDYKRRYNNDVFNILFHLNKGKTPEELAYQQANLNIRTLNALGALEERLDRMDERRQKGEIREEQRGAKLTEAVAKAEKAQADAKKAAFQASDDFLEIQRRGQKLKVEKGFVELAYLDELSKAREKALLAQANWNNSRYGLEKLKIETQNANETKNSLEKILGDSGQLAANEAEAQAKELKAVAYYAKYVDGDGNLTAAFYKDFPQNADAKTRAAAAKKLGLTLEGYDARNKAITDFQVKNKAGQVDSETNRRKTLDATNAVVGAIKDLQIQLAKKSRGASDFQGFADGLSEKAIKLNQLLISIKTRQGEFAGTTDANGRTTFNDDDVKKVRKAINEILNPTTSTP